MAKAEYTFDIRVEGAELLDDLARALDTAERLTTRWRIAAAIGWAVAAALAAAMLLGCSAPPGVGPELEPDPDACPEVPAADVPLPDGCVDSDCRHSTSLERCTRDYVCESRPGVCIRGWRCGCARELAACLGAEDAVPSVCE
jgi:hypothetical protein